MDEATLKPYLKKDVAIRMAGQRIEFAVSQTLFSSHQVDIGSAHLLKTLPLDLIGDKARILDLGCGYGPIALTMARRSPEATVWAVDVNERARALCVANAERNGLTNIRVCAPDDVPPDVRFATIWSNPAIRIGKPALHSMLMRWLPSRRRSITPT